jgi:hypothetical protein
LNCISHNIFFFLGFVLPGLTGVVDPDEMLEFGIGVDDTLGGELPRRTGWVVARGLPPGVLSGEAPGILLGWSVVVTGVVGTVVAVVVRVVFGEVCVGLGGIFGIEVSGPFARGSAVGRRA